MRGVRLSTAVLGVLAEVGRVFRNRSATLMPSLPYQVVMISSIFAYSATGRHARLWNQLGFLRRRKWWHSFVGLQVCL